MRDIVKEVGPTNEGRQHLLLLHKQGSTVETEAVHLSVSMSIMQEMSSITSSRSYPEQLMRPAIGQNVSCAVGDFV